MNLSVSCFICVYKILWDKFCLDFFISFKIYIVFYFHFNLSSIVAIAFLLKNVIIFIVRWVRCDGRKLSGTEMQMTILTFLPYFLLISFVHETTERDISPGSGNIDNRRNEREILAVYSPSRNAIIYNNTRIDESQTCHSAKPCRPGVLIPVWQPQTLVIFRFRFHFSDSANFYENMIF